jgi:hypothetical protein
MTGHGTQPCCSRLRPYRAPPSGRLLLGNLYLPVGVKGWQKRTHGDPVGVKGKKPGGHDNAPVMGRPRPFSWNSWLLL